MKTPTKIGYYWARWMTAAGGTHEGHELTPAPNWEIVQVWANEYFAFDPTDDEAFGVSVPGVRETQWLKNFRWDVGPSGKPEPIPEPGMEVSHAN